MRFNLTTYLNMLRAGLGIDQIQQRICVDVQCNYNHPDVVRFVEDFLAQIKSGAISFNQEPPKELIDPLMRLSDSKYKRMEEKGINNEQISLTKIYDDVNNESGKKNVVPVDPSSIGIKEIGSVEFLDITINDHEEDDSGKTEAELRAKKQKLETNELRYKLYNDPDFLKSFLDSLNEYYSKENGNQQSQSQNYEESPTSLKLEDNDENNKLEKMRKNPTFDVAPTPEEVEVKEPQTHSITGTEYIGKVNIPGVMYFIENVFPKEECERLIDFFQFSQDEMNFQKLIQEAETKNGRIIIRTSLRRKVIDYNIAKIVWEAVKNLVPEQLDDGRKLTGIRSKMNFYKYTEGEFFNTHVDGGFRNTETGESSEYTFVVYLNDDFEGGSTRFCDVDFWESEPTKVRQVNAKQGGVLVFRQPNMRHCGSTILKGAKYILQGMVMYGPLNFNKFGKPIGKAPYSFAPQVCECD